MRPTFIGLEIGGTKIQLVAGDERGAILHRARFTVEASAGAAGIRRQIEAALPPMLDAWKPAALGVGFGGPVHRNTGRIARSHQIAGWADFDLGEWLRRLGGRSVVVENDANVAALAESTFGAGVGHSPLFYFNLGSGIGGGLVIDGRIYHGSAPGEFEFGRLRLQPTGPTVEDRCSGWAIDRRLRALAAATPEGTLARLIGGSTGGEAKHLQAAIEAGDADARRVLDELAADLAFALSHVVHLFHPAAIVMGGGLALVGEPLRAAIAAQLPPHLMAALRDTAPLQLAALGEDAVPLGALLLARQSVGADA